VAAAVVLRAAANMDEVASQLGHSQRPRTDAERAAVLPAAAAAVYACMVGCAGVLGAAADMDGAGSERRFCNCSAAAERTTAAAAAAALFLVRCAWSCSRRGWSRESAKTQSPATYRR
jgi:hypothetical protein